MASSEQALHGGIRKGQLHVFAAMTSPKVTIGYDSCSLPLLRWAKCVIEDASFRLNCLKSGAYYSLEIKGARVLVDPVNGSPKIVDVASNSVAEASYSPRNSGSARLKARMLIGLEFAQ